MVSGLLAPETDGAPKDASSAPHVIEPHPAGSHAPSIATTV